MNHWLTILTLVPFLGGIIVASLGAKRVKLVRGFALASSFVGLGGALCLWLHFDSKAGGLQFVERMDWVPSLGIQYFLGVDGLSLIMVVLTAIVAPLAILVSGPLFDGRAGSPLPTAAGKPEDGAHGVTRPTGPHVYYALILWLQAGLFGTFTALNFFHWFLFWELGLIPAFFLVKLWGGPNRGPAATQFFIYTMVGSIALLLSFLAIRLATGSFDFIELAQMAKSGVLQQKLSATFGWRSIGLIVFFGAFLGFAVKVPLIPFHTWLPAAYSEAPSPVTMLLTGVMSKMGVYGFLRILLPIFPDQIRQVLSLLLWLAVATIVLSAFAAFAQKDLKRMLAYSSINHLGYCLLALFAAASVAVGVNNSELQKAAALNGALLQMFNHGLTASALFLFVALIEKRSGGLRGLEDFGGIRKVVPVLTGLMGIAIFSSLGLPGLNGFIGEFLVFKGVFPLAPWAAVIATVGLLVTAIFLLTLIQRVFCGPLNERWAKLPDLSLRERALVVPSIALMFVLGVWPQLILGRIDATVVNLVHHITF
ncbi:MAG TPA: NADH-quinone oxidoreductase subunit M [Candidatus Binatia bacterium]|nr:NADH-quinone oxidoreductase subunit M [Candidatus Binatia bacterium]